MTTLDDANVSPRSRAISRTEFCEQLRNTPLIPQPSESQPAIGNRVDSRPSNQWFHNALQLLRLRQSCPDQFVLHKRCRHVPEHRVVMGTISIEMPAGFSVSHCLRSTYCRQIYLCEFRACRTSNPDFSPSHGCGHRPDRTTGLRIKRKPEYLHICYRFRPDP